MEAAGRDTRVVIEGMTFDNNRKGKTDSRHTAKLRVEKVEKDGRLHAIRGGDGPKRSGPITSIAPVRPLPCCHPLLRNDYF